MPRDTKQSTLRGPQTGRFGRRKGRRGLVGRLDQSDAVFASKLRPLPPPLHPIRTRPGGPTADLILGDAAPFDPPHPCG
ncbi:hypothetical protein GE061_018613 [Apolygus lucorum]|uniref:Uncharacterized protein n=1 Tax=Apolygus lucorum TaxID=248454 RepID=A0A8S9XED9_APOLU|nr:hypothetical protein GE061_018613 [Apolygus lucorum]